MVTNLEGTKLTWALRRACLASLILITSKTALASPRGGRLLFADTEEYILRLMAR